MRLRCPACRQTFPWDANKGFPEYCQIPSCEVYIGTGDNPEVAAPYIALKGGAYAKSVDNVYREAEMASEARMEMAAAMTPGATKEDFSGLKLTDYRSGMTQGETAIKMPEPSREFTQNLDNVAQFNKSIAPAQQIPMHYNQPGQAAAYSAQTRSGPYPNAGLRAMERVKAVHKANVDPRIQGTAISDTPALETRHPTYQRR